MSSYKDPIRGTYLHTSWSFDLQPSPDIPSALSFTKVSRYGIVIEKESSLMQFSNNWTIKKVMIFNGYVIVYVSHTEHTKYRLVIHH